MHGKYPSIKAQSECDLLLAVGVRFSDRATGDLNEYTKKCMTVHIDIDRAEIGKNVSPDVSLWGDVKEILTKILEALPEHKHPEWVAELEGYKHEMILPAPKPYGPEAIIEEVHKHCTDDTVVATDVGQHQMWTMQFYPFEKPHTLLTSGGLGTMGYGLGAAIGGCIAARGRRTVLFTGDGSFGMNLNEMATAVSQELPITIVIFDNDVLGMVRQWQTLFYGKRYSQTVLNDKVDFCKVAEALGCDAIRVTKKEEMEPALREAIAKKAPVLIECVIPEDDKVFPMVPAGAPIAEVFDGDDLKED